MATARAGSTLRGSGSAGFTLVEILLVITLLALLASSVVPNISSIGRAGVQSSTRRFAALVKHAYDQAILTGRTHRIVLDLDRQTWAIESAEPGMLPVDKVKTPVYRDAPTLEPEFAPSKSNLIEPIPGGTEIVEVESFRLGTGTPAANKGSISIYAFPGGFIDEATVTLAEIGKKDTQVFKVTTKPLTGRIVIKSETKGP